LQDVLRTYNSQDQDEIAKLQEREKIRAEVAASMNEQANMFVQEQIKLAHEQMLAEIERRVAQRTSCDAPPRENQGRSFPMRSPVRSRAAQSEIEMEDVSEPLDMSKLRQMLSQAPHQRQSAQGDGAMTNVIGNSSDME
jgi:hypothetical protein